MPESNNEKSFAERFASKKSTTATQQFQSTANTAPASQESNSSFAQNVDVKNQNILTPHDTQKHMLAELIYLVKGIDDGRNAWYYVLVERLKVQLFLKALNDEIIHLENYGKILFSAYGDEPPAEITDKLKEEYGIK